MHAGQQSKLRHYEAESVFSQIIPEAMAAGLEFAVGSARYPTEQGEGFGFAESFFEKYLRQRLGCV